MDRRTAATARSLGHETQIGWIPHWEDFDAEGLDGFTQEDFERVMAIDPEEWRREFLSQGELYLKLHDHLPKELIFQRELLGSRL